MYFQSFNPSNWKSTYEGWNVIKQIHPNNILIHKPHTGRHLMLIPVPSGG